MSFEGPRSKQEDEDTHIGVRNNVISNDMGCSANSEKSRQKAETSGVDATAGRKRTGEGRSDVHWSLCTPYLNPIALQSSGRLDD